MVCQCYCSVALPAHKEFISTGLSRMHVGAHETFKKLIFSRLRSIPVRGISETFFLSAEESRFGVSLELRRVRVATLLFFASHDKCGKHQRRRRSWINLFRNRTNGKFHRPRPFKVAKHNSQLLLFSFDEFAKTPTEKKSGNRERFFHSWEHWAKNIFPAWRSATRIVNIWSIRNLCSPRLGYETFNAIKKPITPPNVRQTWDEVRRVCYQPASRR